MQPGRPSLWRRTPPAIFPPVFGLMGLGLGWRRAAGVFGATDAIGDVLLGVSTVIFLFAVVAYLAKVVRRPGVVAEDLRVLPGRAGIAAMMLTGYLMAAAIVVFSTALATLILVLALAGHGVIVLMILRNLISGPAEARVVTPVWHLVFVGFIISPLAALPLGWTGFSTFVFFVAMALAVGIWTVSLVQMARKEPPVPLRPALAIHLSPAALLGTVAFLLGRPGFGLAFAALSIIILAWLLVRARWIIAGGFSPLWGAFTFPFAAFANLMMIVGDAGYGEAFRNLGGATLIAATLVIIPIVWKVMQMWARGELAGKTNAAVA
jgi:tellurite resistance protein